MYYAKTALKGKKKHGKKCFCKNKGHTTFKCCKCKQKEKLSRSNLASNTLSSKTLGKSLFSKPSSAKSSSRGSSSLFCKTSSICQIYIAICSLSCTLYIMVPKYVFSERTVVFRIGGSPLSLRGAPATTFISLSCKSLAL
jgi:hypothetical protein